MRLPARHDGSRVSDPTSLGLPWPLSRSVWICIRMPPVMISPRASATGCSCLAVHRREVLDEADILDLVELCLVPRISSTRSLKIKQCVSTSPAPSSAVA